MHSDTARVLAAAAGALVLLGSVGPAAATAGRPYRPPLASAPGPVVFAPPCSTATGFRSNHPPPEFGRGGCAGYVASGHDFRYARAIITVPPASVITSDEVAPTLYVGLTSGDAMAITGLTTCGAFLTEFGPPAPAVCSPPGGPPANYIAFAAVVTNNGTAVQTESVSLASTQPGDGVGFRVYAPAGGAAQFTITMPGSAAFAFQLPGAGSVSAAFDHAVALVDYLAVPPGSPPLPPSPPPGPAPGPVDLRITQFQQGGWTTASGARGTFTGPWALNPVVLTSNGAAPPGGAIDVEPAYLWTDGLGGGAGDAFGVWWRV
ncbi:MAG TPA: hypothetical protein VIX86_27480 [Streptosporangiaceae bacterium]